MLVSLYTQIYIHILEVLFPQTCLGCNTPKTPLCHSCSAAILRSDTYISSRIFAACNYKDPIIKKAIWNLKYHKRGHIGEKLGSLLYEICNEDISTVHMYFPYEGIIVVPVPLSQERKRKRGYNQAEKIARGFCMHAPKNIFTIRTDIVIRTINTQAQAKITNKQTRLKNITGAFSITNPTHIVGKIVFVIDDVTTTGGTLTEIMNVLTRCGAKAVYGFAVAH